MGSETVEEMQCEKAEGIEKVNERVEATFGESVTS